MPKKLSEFMKQAHLHGLSDDELLVLARLYRAASEWSEWMHHCRDANNHNGTLHRAVDDARKAFGEIDSPDDPHLHCNWQCVAARGLARCARDQPVTRCECGIVSPTARGACTSCGKAFK
jgi:hypothetical protein